MDAMPLNLAPGRPGRAGSPGCQDDGQGARTPLPAAEGGGPGARPLLQEGRGGRQQPRGGHLKSRSNRIKSTGAGSSPSEDSTQYPGAGPVARSRKAAKPAAPWESLIDLGETESSKDATPAAGRKRRPPWLWGSVAAASILLAIVIALQVVRLKTSNGIIELLDLPKDAVVLIDGEEFKVKWPGGGKPAVITVETGKRRVRVEKDGFKAYGRELTIEAGGKERLTVRLIPLADSPSNRGDDAVVTQAKPRNDISAPVVEPEFVTNRTGKIKLKLIRAGTFTMGSDEGQGESNSTPAQGPDQSVVLPGRSRGDPGPI